MVINRRYVFSQRSPICDGMIYIVQRGDTLDKLVKEYKVSIENILDANPDLDPYNLQAGMEICIPDTWR